MVAGVFAEFEHEHDLEALPPHTDGRPRTRMTDELSWRSPTGLLGHVADAVLVRRTLAELLADHDAEIVRRLGRAGSA
ncbi:hypothetical protein [Quadrisphaera sp. DSM 44207]|uniref:hypothetical protein n=1 Tax=Quadrisphaera sp. DSM 44207 TaxID=1881057 RepID=UPI000B822294|nr:hypothetical protein [Quadrisphaera sp. DSM 44207]